MVNEKWNRKCEHSINAGAACQGEDVRPVGPGEGSRSWRVKQFG